MGGTKRMRGLGRRGTVLLGRLLSRLSPDSLLARLILIFSCGFFAILLLTSIYAGESHHFYFLRGLMADRTRRMAETAVLLDTCPADIRFILRDRLASKGFSVHFSAVSPLLRAENEDLREASELMEYMLNFSLSRLYDGVPLERGNGTFGSVEVPRRAVLVVNDMNIPSPLESFMRSVQHYFGSAGAKRRTPSAYEATAAVPLHDGTWIVIRDSSPGYPPLPRFQVSGVMLMELFFVLISLLAFYLCVKPLRRLARAADRFGRDIPGTPPLEETGPTEVREAAQAFNRMQRSIRAFVDERERMIAAVSHDLRTPLTRMRLRVEQLNEQQRLPLLRDIDELRQLMDSTIDAARSSGEPAACVDVASLLESLVEDRQDMGLDIRLEDRLQDPEALFGIAPLKARPLSMKRCLSNLMDNALRYGKHVVVGAEDGPDTLTVTIADSGPGIPEGDMEKVFEPFYRSEPSRNRSTGGTGLGLSIARTMARLHGGDVILSNRPEGGLLATVTFKRT